MGAIGHRRIAALVAAAALIAAAALAAPASAAPISPPDLRSGPGGSPCRGQIGWYSVSEPGNPLLARVDHSLSISCDSVSIALEGLSELHFDGDLDSSNAFDRVTCGPTTLSCVAARRSEPQLLALPLRHRVWFRMRRTDGSVWTGDSICTGEGTSVVTCEHNQVLLVGSSGSETFG
jgi:hypothetical protein